MFVYTMPYNPMRETQAQTSHQVKTQPTGYALNEVKYSQEKRKEGKTLTSYVENLTFIR